MFGGTPVAMAPGLRLGLYKVASLIICGCGGRVSASTDVQACLRSKKQEIKRRKGICSASGVLPAHIISARVFSCACGTGSVEVRRAIFARARLLELLAETGGTQRLGARREPQLCLRSSSATERDDGEKVKRCVRQGQPAARRGETRTESFFSFNLSRAGTAGAINIPNDGSRESTWKIR